MLAEVTRSLCARSHNLTLITFDKPGWESFYPLHPDIRRVGLGLGPTDRPTSPMSTIGRVVGLRKEIKRHSPDVAVGFMHSMYLPLGVALVGSGCPVVGSEHQAAEHYRARPFQRMLLHMAPHVLAQMTCVSEQARRAFPPRIQRIMVPISNPVTVRSNKRADALGRTEQKTLLAVGRLDPQKAQNVLIEAFASVAKQVPNWNLRIVGEGPSRGNLTRLIHSLGMVDRIQMPGAVADVSSEYMRSQLFVVPSRFESFGMTTAEALAHGLPAVGFEDCPGTNLLIRPGVNGALAPVAVDRVASLALTLLPLMVDDRERTRLSVNAPAMNENFSTESIAGRWEELLSDVAGKP